MTDCKPESEPQPHPPSPFSQCYEKPWGSEWHWTPPSLPFVGKVLHINAGHRLSLQRHDDKVETWLLIRGRASVLWDDEDGNLVEVELEPGRGYTCASGQRHRLIGISDSEIVEVSTPERGTTWRLEDDYDRPHETPDQRLFERTGLKQPTVQ